MYFSLSSLSVQVTVCLLIQCLCMWIASEARARPYRRKQEDRKLHNRVNRTHKPCSGDSDEVLSDNPCDKCRCVNGIARCHKTHCPNEPIMCVDSVTPTEGCCTQPTCPNGPNCWNKGEKMDGRKLQREKNYDNGCLEICSCPPAWKTEYTSNTQADCKTHCPIRRPRRG